MHEKLIKLQHESVHVFQDKALGFIAIIAVHSTQNGPAIGGCRCLRYSDFDSAMQDALHLSAAMTRKSLVHNLPHGGAKSVIMLPKHNIDRKALFIKFGEYVNSLNGMYIAAVDSGTNANDMENIALSTQHVITNSTTQSETNASINTANGVYQAIIGAAEYIFRNDDLSNRTILVQGLGSVGLYLTEKLLTTKANIIITDTNSEKLAQISAKYNLKTIEPGAIANQKCDIFVPCALGGVLSQQFCESVQTKIIVGAANNQFMGNFTNFNILKQRKIAWVLDYLANGGGLIHVAQLFNKDSLKSSNDKIASIKNKSYKFLETSMENPEFDLTKLLNYEA